jgi:hypothetical protein
LSAAFSPDGKRIVTAPADRTARVRDVFADAQSSASHARIAGPALPDTGAARRLLPPPPLRRHGASKWQSGVRYARMETVARGQAPASKQPMLPVEHHP